MKRFITEVFFCIGFIVLGSFYEKVNAQSIKPVKIGDKVPDITIKNLFNYKKSSFKISELKGKVIILDFWETFCSPCIGALPKIEKMQDHFKDKLQVITITKYDTKERILQQLISNVKLKKFNLPTIIHDDKLFKYFPYKFISHVVWINSEGVVVAFTGTEHITEPNIQMVIDKKPLNWPVKYDLIDFDYKAPFLNLSNSEVSKLDFFFYSSFTGALNGVDQTDRKSIDSLNKTVCYNFFNQGLLDLCKGSVTGQLTGNYDMKEVIFEVKDPKRYSNNGYYWTTEGTSSENKYCYSVTLPLNRTEEERKQIIANDLSRWLNITLGITIKKEMRLVSSLVLKAKKNPFDYQHLKAIGDTDGRIIIEDSRKQFINMPFIQLVLHLNGDVDSIPYAFNETAIPNDFKVDLDFNIKSFADLAAFRKALEPYGLELVEEKREREMFVITEKDWKK